MRWLTCLARSYAWEAPPPRGRFRLSFTGRPCDYLLMRIKAALWSLFLVVSLLHTPAHAAKAECRGQEATIVGSRGDDEMTGTRETTS